MQRISPPLKAESAAPMMRPHKQSTDAESALARSMTRLATWPALVISGTLFVAFAVIFFASSAPFSIPEVEAACGQPPLDVRFYSTSGEVQEFLEDCGESGRTAYRNMQLADLLYPLVFGVFMASALAKTLRHRFPDRPTVVTLAAIPLVGSGFDYLENLFAWLALSSFPDPASSNALLGLASAAKTTTFWLAGVLLLAAIGTLPFRRQTTAHH